MESFCFYLLQFNQVSFVRQSRYTMLLFLCYNLLINSSHPVSIYVTKSGNLMSREDCFSIFKQSMCVFGLKSGQHLIWLLKWQLLSCSWSPLSSFFICVYGIKRREAMKRKSSQRRGHLSVTDEWSNCIAGTQTLRRTLDRHFGNWRNWNIMRVLLIARAQATLNWHSSERMLWSSTRIFWL